MQHSSISHSSSMVLLLVLGNLQSEELRSSGPGLVLALISPSSDDCYLGILANHRS